MCLFPTLLRNFKNKNCNLFTFIVTDFCVYHKLSKQQPTIKDQVCINKHLGVQNEAGQRLTEFWQENALVIAKPSSNNTREDSIHGHHQMVNTEIRLIIFFVAKDGVALYSQQKQDQELTVAQIMNSLLPNSDLNGRK